MKNALEIFPFKAYDTYEEIKKLQEQEITPEEIEIRKKWDTEDVVSFIGRNIGKCLDLRYANLERAYLREKNLSGSDLSEVNLRWADLQRAILYRVNLRWADLELADIRNAKLNGAILYRAILCGADLWSADLRGVELKWADLRYAALYMVELCGVDLCDVDLGKVKYLDTSELKGANYNGKTNFPPSFNPSKHEMISRTEKKFLTNESIV